MKQPDRIVASTRSVVAISELKLRMARTIALIPRGRVASYGQIAALSAAPRHARLVAKVLNEHEHLPWHRVVRSSGLIAFAAGSEFAKRQARLLGNEQVRVVNNRVVLRVFGWHRAALDLSAFEMLHGDCNLPELRREKTARSSVKQ
jgi:methylated-DNA-protein-cysteine methyltransferase-like protein